MVVGLGFAYWVDFGFEIRIFWNRLVIYANDAQAGEVPQKPARQEPRQRFTRGNYVAFGDYGLQALEHAWITAKQIEAGRVACSHFLRREGRVFIRVFPHKPVSAKPLEVRMGSGKGEPEYWCAVVKPGTMLFEITGVDEATAKRALARVAHKMPITTRFVAPQARSGVGSNSQHCSCPTEVMNGYEVQRTSRQRRRRPEAGTDRRAPSTCSICERRP